MQSLEENFIFTTRLYLLSMAGVQLMLSFPASEYYSTENTP